jgi:hypothetical protein
MHPLIITYIIIQFLFALMTVLILGFKENYSVDFWEIQIFLWTPAQIYRYNKKINWVGAFFLAFLLLVFNTIPYLIRILCYLFTVGRRN